MIVQDNVNGDYNLQIDDAVYRGFQEKPKTCEVSPTSILIKYLPGATKLEQIEKGDWIDLYCYEDTILKAGERTYISQGIAMKLPEGYEAITAPRSSTFKRYGILQTNSIGVIDSTYCGDNDIWMFPAYATRDIEIPAGTRICQFRIQKIQPKINFTEVSSLGESRGGLGSTGV